MPPRPKAFRIWRSTAPKPIALLARITELAAPSKGDHAPVRRAMRNLHGALAEKIANAGDDEVMHRIAALLDEVTQKIERSLI